MLFIVFSFSATAHAQRKNISGQEAGVLTFYRLSGLTPDFTSWITATKKYNSLKTLDPVEADNYLHEEQLRLQYALGTIDLENNYLDIQTDVMAALIEKEGKYFIKVLFPGSTNNEPYFPYNVHDMWVAVIMKDIEKFTLIPVSHEQAVRLQGYLPEGMEKALKLDIVFRGISAQNQPIKVDNVDQYIMLGEIARWSLSMQDFHQSQNDTLWEFIAPSYRTEEEDDLIQLLEGR